MTFKKKPQPAPKASTPTGSEPLATPAALAQLRKQFADFPFIETLERRLLNPEVPGTLPIRLTDEPAEHEDPVGKKRRWHLRWINTAIPGRYQHITQGRGYAPVVWGELRNRDDIADRFEGASEVRRGDRGTDMLVKMPMPYFRLVKRAEREQALKRARSKDAQKEELQQTLGRHFGAQAAEAGAHFVGDGVRELPPRSADEMLNEPL
jgi:hypothetical protein